MKHRQPGNSLNITGETKPDKKATKISACLTRNGRTLSIQVFHADGHHGWALLTIRSLKTRALGLFVKYYTLNWVSIAILWAADNQQLFHERALYRRGLKELRHDILSHFFDGLSHVLSVVKPKSSGLLMKEKTKGVILKQKRTRMAEDAEDWNGLEMTTLKISANFFKMRERWRSSFNNQRGA